MSEGHAATPVEPAGRAVVWYRSLYWRIAIGFVVTVAVVLALQAAIFLWLASQTTLRLQTPVHVAAVAASDLGDALDADPALDVDAWLALEYGRLPHRVFVLRADERLHRSGDFEVPPMAVRAARVRLRMPTAAGPARERPPAFAARRERTPRRTFFQPVIVGDQTVAVVGVLPEPRRGNPVLAEFGPALTLAGFGLLLAGTGLMAVVVFRPVHRRLRGLEAAAAAVGAGETAVRAPEAGGDEVASLARRFNRMAADLEARVHELREADRSRRQLLADVSHELMTPLTAMRGYLETLALPGAVKDEAARARYLAIVTEETLRLEAIIGDLLDLARLEGGGGALEPEPVSLERLFARAFERHHGILDERRIALERRVHPAAASIVGDERRLEQAVQNLVANAVRHTPAGGRIALEARPAGGHAVAIVVDDSGRGIPVEHLPHVFDRFYRVDSSRDARSGGSGLGLSIVRAVVERHGGRVSAGTSPLGGARFTIELPRDGSGLDADLSDSGTPA
jgi:two-component system sensor histidine kinase BaeS